MKPRFSYLICSTQRSGSSLFAEYLSGSGMAGQPGVEYFYSENEALYMQQWGTADLRSYCRQVVAVSTTDNGVCGVKIMVDHLERLIARLREENQRPTAGTREVLEEFFPNLHHVWICRRDKVRQAVSWAKALQTGVWSQLKGEAESASAAAEVRYDPEQIDRLLDEILISEAAWQRYFIDVGADPYVITYEELVADPEKQINRLLRHWGILTADEVRLPEPQLKKQSDARSQEWMEQYLQYRRQRPRSYRPRGAFTSVNPDVIENAPAELTREERYLLHALVLGCHPRRVLEIGSRYGGTTQIIVHALDAVNEGTLIRIDPQPELKIDWESVAHRAELLCVRAPEAIAQARALAGGPFDFCFIDDWYVYGQVFVGACAVLEHMAPEGYILFHDAYQPQTREAIEDFLAISPCLVDCGYIARSTSDDTPDGPWAGFRLVRVSKGPAIRSEETPSMGERVVWRQALSEACRSDLLRAEQLIRENRPDEARVILNAILMKEQTLDVLNDYAVIELMQGHLTAARALLRKVLQIAPHHTAALRNLQCLDVEEHRHPCEI